MAVSKTARFIDDELRLANSVLEIKVVKNGKDAVWNERSVKLAEQICRHISKMDCLDSESNAKLMTRLAGCEFMSDECKATIEAKLDLKHDETVTAVADAALDRKQPSNQLQTLIGILTALTQSDWKKNERQNTKPRRQGNGGSKASLVAGNRGML